MKKNKTTKKKCGHCGKYIQPNKWIPPQSQKLCDECVNSFHELSDVFLLESIKRADEKDN